MLHSLLRGAALVADVLGATALANVLMLPIVARVFRPLFEPRLTWFFRSPPADESRPPAEESRRPADESPSVWFA